jgi:hypothetical protein
MSNSDLGSTALIWKMIICDLRHGTDIDTFIEIIFVYLFPNQYIRMISRHWIGTVKNEKVSDYLIHLEKTVIPNLNSTQGLKNAYYLKRAVREGTEFLIVTEWDNVESIKLFAGQDYDTAVVDPYARSLMVSYEKKVRHYTI